MTPTPSLRELFETALALPQDERAAFIEAHGADADQRVRLQRMLALDPNADDALLKTPAAALADALFDEDTAPTLRAGSRVGSFELIEVLGEGGSSTVFRASRVADGVRQDVALKLLRRALYSPDAQRQFRRERTALSQLQHPNIAHLIEGGVTETGLAYIALELVSGTPITDYARERRLDVRARLQLFLQVCGAVDAAHRALIVHRDLKPSNVLITADGAVKLLDFGIAKLLGAEDDTHTRLPAFTPAYASPEQRAGGLITTATDVYGLGVLLGELMTGERLSEASARTPSSCVSNRHDAGVLPAAVAVTRRQLRGDLDNIVMKALDTDPAQRYASAGMLAQEIERLLEGRPVAAHPPSGWYRARKFVLRHRGSVATTLIVLLAVLAALGAALSESNRARHEALRANTLHGFMVSAFEQAEPSVPREGPPRITEVVEQAITKAREDTRMNPDVRTELLSELGTVLRVQGRLDPALQTLRWNHEQALRELGENSPTTIKAGQELERTLILTGDYDAARTLIDTLLGHAPVNDIATHASLLFDSALLATKQHELHRALADGGDALRQTRTLGDADKLAQALSEFGNVQQSANDSAGASASFEEALSLREKQFGAQHLSVAAAHADLSRAYRRQHHAADAEREIRAALAIDAAVLSKDDWRHANDLNALTMVLLEQRDFRAALDTASETLRINRIAHGDDHPEVANDLNNVGMLQAILEDYSSAAAPLRESLALSEAKFGAEHFETAVTRANYGVVLARAGDVRAGEAEIRHAIASLEAAEEPDFDEQAATYEKLVRVKLDRNDAAAALPLIDRLDAVLTKLETPGAYWDGRAAILRARALVELGRPAQAQPVLAAAGAQLARSQKADVELGVEVVLLQATAARALGDREAEQRIAADGRARLAALRNPPNRLTRLAEALAK